MTSNEQAALLRIARQHFPRLETLETQRSDSLDFHDAAVWSIRAALEAAYRAGQASLTSTDGKVTMKRQKQRQEALAAFIAKKAEIDAMLARISKLSEDHFGIDPGSVHWGHVGNLEYYAQQLKRVTDSAFGEGEHAE